MSEPILVVDPGTVWTTAAIVTDGGSELLKEPSSGSYCWPTSVALDGDTLRVGTVAERRKRSDPLLYAGRLTAGLRPDRQVQLGDRRYPARELLSALLGVLRVEAERLAGLPVGRVLLLNGEAGGSLPPPARELAAAAAGAGFADAELLFLPAAVAMAAPADQPGRADAGPDGELVLVCDAGASALRLTLIRAVAGQAGTSLASAAVPACGGDMLDGLLTESMSRGRSTKWVRPLIAAPGAAGARAKLDLAELARRIRHELTDASQAEDTMTPLTPVVRFSRQDFEKMMRPALGQMSSACREVLGKSGGLAGTRVMLVGGCARTPAVQRTLGSALGRPVRPAPAPELAALHGGIAWAEAAATRRVTSVPVPVGLHGLAWSLPGDAARLIGFAVAPGAAYESGEPLARVRTDDDAIWDLASGEPGTLDQYCAGADAIVATGDVLVVERRAPGPADRRSSPLRLSALAGDLCGAFGRDGRQCATADVSGMVRIWDAETAAELTRFQARTPERPGGLAAAMAENGHWLVACSADGGVAVQDITAGRQIARLAKGGDLRAVQFSGDGRYLCTVEGKRIRIWEASGREVMSVKERLLSGDGAAVSRDGRRLALVSRTAIEVWDQPGRQRTIIRRLPQAQGTVRHLAFSADATRLLLAYDSTLELMSAHDGQMLWSAALPVPVRHAEFAPDDSLIATVSMPSGAAPVSLRDAATGDETAQAGSADGPYGWARFSPDGRFLISSAGDDAALWALAY